MVNWQISPRALYTSGAQRTQFGANRNTYITQVFNPDGTVRRTLSTSGFNRPTVDPMYLPNYNCNMYGWGGYNVPSYVQDAGYMSDIYGFLKGCFGGKS